MMVPMPMCVRAKFKFKVLGGLRQLTSSSIYFQFMQLSLVLSSAPRGGCGTWACWVSQYLVTVIIRLCMPWPGPENYIRRHSTDIAGGDRSASQQCRGPEPSHPRARTRSRRLVVSGLSFFFNYFFSCIFESSPSFLPTRALEPHPWCTEASQGATTDDP